MNVPSGTTTIIGHTSQSCSMSPTSCPNMDQAGVVAISAETASVLVSRALTTLAAESGTPPPFRRPTRRA